MAGASDQLDAYREASGNGAPADLVLRHGELLRRIAYHLIARLPDNVQVDDLLQAGAIGLMEAAQAFDDGQGASFETFAGIRIRGAMLDEVRRMDWTPRSVHRHSREVSHAIHELEEALGRAPSEGEIAEALQVPLETYRQWANDACASRVLSLDDDGDGDQGRALMDTLLHPDESPEQQTHSEGFRAALAEAIEHLPKREQLIMSLYYDEELNLREIGQVLDISESRVCQLHGQLTSRLRAFLREWVGEYDQ